MKILILIIVMTLASCSQTKERSNRTKPEPVTQAAIEAAVREFVQEKRAEFLGVTLHRRTDDYYFAGANVRCANGNQDVIQLRVRRYQKDGTQYWRAEWFSKHLVDDLKKC